MAAVREVMADSGLAIELRQSKYLNSIVEQDHRAIKRRVRPMMGFKSFWAARRILAGVETMHMIRKGQMSCAKAADMPSAQQFYSLAI
jgi:putative transposase